MNIGPVVQQRVSPAEKREREFCCEGQIQVAILRNIGKASLQLIVEQKLEGDQGNRLGEILEKNIPFK